MDAQQLSRLIKESGKTDLSILISAKEEAKAKVLENPTNSNLQALERANKMLEVKMKETGGTQNIEFKETSSGAAVLRYLQDSGWQIEKSQFYEHIREGKLSKSKGKGKGVYTKKKVDRYAVTWLRRIETGLTVGDEEDTISRERREEELKKARIDRKRAEFKLNQDMNRYILREDLARELAARAGVLDSSYERMVRAEVIRFVHEVGGDAKKAPILEGILLSEFNDILNEFATTRRFHVLVVPAQEEEDQTEVPA